jgi:hypothetical protein
MANDIYKLFNDPKQHFRPAGPNMVFSLRPGGEGRIVSEEEAVQILADLTQSDSADSNLYRRALKKSFLVGLLFAIAGFGTASLYLVLAGIGIPGLITVFSLPPLIVRRWKRRLAIATALDRRPLAESFIREERIKNGWGPTILSWMLTLVIYVVAGFFKVHPAKGIMVFGYELHSLQMQAILFIFVFALISVFVLGSAVTFKKWYSARLKK